MCSNALSLIRNLISLKKADALPPANLIQEMEVFFHRHNTLDIEEEDLISLPKLKYSTVFISLSQA